MNAMILRSLPSVSQNIPSKPSRQSQITVPFTCTPQIPPFLHGFRLPSHGFDTAQELEYYVTNFVLHFESSRDFGKLF